MVAGSPLDLEIIMGGQGISMIPYALFLLSVCAYACGDRKCVCTRPVTALP
jgi:hypothetical protein